MDMLVGKLDVAQIGVVVAATKLGIAALEGKHTLFVLSVLVRVGGDVSSRAVIDTCRTEGCEIFYHSFFPGQTAVARGNVDGIALVVGLFFTRYAVYAYLAVVGHAKSAISVGRLNCDNGRLVYFEKKLALLLAEISLYRFKVGSHSSNASASAFFIAR